jgi:3-hydroxybutyryl-CoA dehydratase
MSALSDYKEGTPLPEIRKDITQEHINLYAKASRDFNPIHLDAEFARTTPAGGTIAHGMLVLAYISEMMTAAFSESWLTGGKLNVRFRAPARPGDTITASGQVRRVEPGEGLRVVTCEVLCRNQNDEPVITGEATVAVRT